MLQGQNRMSTVKWVSDWTCPSVQCPMSDGHVQLSTTLSTSSSSFSTCLSDGRATDNEDREQCVSVNFAEWLDVPLYLEPSTFPQCLQSLILQVQSWPEKGFEWKFLILWDLLCRIRINTFHRSLNVKIYHSRTFLRGKSGLRQQFYHISIFFVFGWERMLETFSSECAEMYSNGLVVRAKPSHTRVCDSYQPTQWQYFWNDVSVEIIFYISGNLLFFHLLISQFCDHIWYF